MKISRILLVISLISLTAVSCAGPLGGGSSTAGVAKTTNGGLDWLLMNTVVTGVDRKGQPQTNSQLGGTDVYKLAFEPGNSQRVYAATSTDGVYFSEDSGESWKQILSQIAVFDMAIDPGNSDHIYVAGSAGGNGKVLESKDKGGSWEEIYNEVSRQNPVQAIAMNPANSNDVVIGLQSGNVIKSTDAGNSWALLQNFSDSVKQITWNGSGLYVLAGTRGLYVSTTGGTLFQNIAENLLNFDRSQFSIEDDELEDVNLPPNSVREFNQFVVSPRTSDLVYVAADNGLYKTQDGGITWQYMKLPRKANNSSLPVTAVALGDTDSLVYSGIGNTVYKSLNSGESWQVQSVATSASIHYILIDPRLGQIAYAGLNGGNR